MAGTVVNGEAFRIRFKQGVETALIRNARLTLVDVISDQ